MNKKLYTSLIFSNLVVFKILSSNHRMYNLYTKFVKILEICKQMDGGEEQFFVDFKPIEVCRVARGKRCKMGRTGDFSKAPDFGFCASQNTYYFGYKLHALCGLSGVIHSYDLSKASVADLQYIKDVKHTYHDCNIYGDKG